MRCCQVLLANDLGSVHGDHELLIPTDEELMIAMDTAEIVGK